MSSRPPLAFAFAISLGFAFALGGAATEAQSPCPNPRPAGAWCAGDVVVGVGQPEPAGGTPAADRYLVLDQNGVDQQALSTRDAVGAGTSSIFASFSTGCAQVPTTGDLLTAGFHTNVVSRIPVNSRKPVSFVDATRYLRTDPGCDASDPGEGCGAVESIVVDRKGNYYVGTIDGTNQILKYSPSSANPVQKYPVQVGNRGADWIELSVDQITMFYTSEDNRVRVFRLDGSPLSATLAKDGVTPLVDLVAAGVTTIDDPVAFDPSNPAADANGLVHLDPDHLGLFGEIPITLMGAPEPTANPSYALRLLPPGDGTGGMLVAANVAVVRMTLDGRTTQSYGDANALGVFAVNVTPDGEFLWTATLDLSATGPASQLVKFHIPTGQRVVGPAVPAGAVFGMCVIQGYSAGATQPDCHNPANAGHPMCAPLPNCIEDASDPRCARTLPPPVVTPPPASAPICTNATATTSTIWPPNHRFVPIAVRGVTDPNGDPIRIRITRVAQDEPTLSRGDLDADDDDCDDEGGDHGRHRSDDDHGGGFTPIDGFSLGPLAFVRAERAAHGDGRLYEIGFTADDGKGGMCSGRVFVGVPQSRYRPVIDSIARFDSTVPTNRPPIARSDTAFTHSGTTVTIAVLANDADFDRNALQVTSATAGARGTTTIIAGKTIAYKPNAGFAGTDMFTYTISDGHGGTAIAKVIVTVKEYTRRF
jgi:hypothetical protein